MPLVLKNAAALAPKTSETVEAVGIVIPVYPHLTTAEKLTFFAAQTDDPQSPLFVLRAFSIFTQWRCPPEDHVTFEQLAGANLEQDEIAAIATAVSRLFEATRENEPEGEAEGKAKKGKKS